MSMTQQAADFVRVPIGSEHPARSHEIRFRGARGPLAGHTVRLGQDADAKWMALGGAGFLGEAGTHGEAMRMVATEWLASPDGQRIQ
jgi:hypothetical protein